MAANRDVLADASALRPIYHVQVSVIALQNAAITNILFLLFELETCIRYCGRRAGMYRYLMYIVTLSIPVDPCGCSICRNGSHCA